MAQRWTARRIRELKGRERIPVLTCYDWAMAKLCDEAEIPALLVGDSLGNVILGHETTLPVTMEDMIHHAAAVMRARPRSLVIVDMPFLSFQLGPERALEAAGRLVQATGADAVKLEGGSRSAAAVRAIVEAGIPVMGHLGLTPQSVLEFGGFGVQGRGRAGDVLLQEARAIEEAGAFAIVLEKIPAPLAGRITRALSVPTIGIGAGAECDGQVLVLYDLLGLVPDFRPRFVKRYAEAGAVLVDAMRRYREEVQAGIFPGPEHSYAESAEPPEAASASGAAAGPGASRARRARPRAASGGAKRGGAARANGSPAARASRADGTSAARSSRARGATKAPTSRSAGSSRTPASREGRRSR